MVLQSGASSLTYKLPVSSTRHFIPFFLFFFPFHTYWYIVWKNTSSFFKREKKYNGVWYSTLSFAQTEQATLKLYLSLFESENRITSKLSVRDFQPFFFVVNLFLVKSFFDWNLLTVTAINYLPTIQPKLLSVLKNCNQNGTCHSQPAQPPVHEKVTIRQAGTCSA